MTIVSRWRCDRVSFSAGMDLEEYGDQLRVGEIVVMDDRGEVDPVQVRPDGVVSAMARI